MRLGRVIAAIAGACVAGSVALPSLTNGPAPAALVGCFADNCSADGFNVWAEQGRMLDANTWESAPITGGWADFQGADYIYFHGAFGGRTPYAYQIFLSVSANPATDNNSQTPAAGNVVLVSQVGPDQIAVSNGTCSHYYIRVVLFAEPFPPAPTPAPDAGDVDASDLDAGDAGDSLDGTDAEP